MECKEITAQRYYFFDNLRAFIVLMVVVFHIGMCYTTWDLSWWCVNDVKKSPVFDYFVLATDVYLMPVMFMIAGYFAPGVLVSKNSTAFWKAKGKRIVIPWIGGTLFLAPFIAYSTFYSRMEVPPNYFSFWQNDFWGPYYQQGPYWFLGILTLFFLLLTLLYQLNPVWLKKGAVSHPKASFFLLFVLFTAASFWGVNLFFWNDSWVNVKFIFMVQPVRFILLLSYFALGVYAWQQGWFTHGGYNPRLVPWLVWAIVMLVVFLFYRVTFTLTPDIPVIFKAGHGLVHASFCLTATMALTALFQHFFDSDASLWRRLAHNSYTMYFIHPFVYIPISYFVQKTDEPIAVKYIGVSLVSLLLCFLLAEYMLGPLLFQKKEGKRLLHF